MSFANNPAGKSGHDHGGPPRKDNGKGKAPASNDDSARPQWHLGAAGNALPGTGGSNAFPSRQSRAAESFRLTGNNGSQGNGAAQPTESGIVGAVDDLEERRVDLMRRLLTSNFQAHEANSGQIPSGAAQNPVHGPEDYDNLSDSELTADPEQEEHDEDEDVDEDVDDNGVPPTQAGSSRDPLPKTESKKPSKKGDPTRPYKCPEPHCPKGTTGFQRPDHLVRHMLDHYDPPYICARSGCNTEARRKDKLKDHLMRKHDLDNEEAKTEANALALAAKSMISRINNDIKQRLAAQPISAGNQVTHPEEEEAGQVDEADEPGDELYDSEDAAEDNTQNTLDARYNDVSSDDTSSDDGEDSDDEASGRQVKGKRPRDNSDDDGAGRKRVNIG